MLLAGAILATSCATNNAGSGCHAFRPIAVDADSLACMTRELAQQIVEHNAVGRELCAWR